MLAVLFNGEPIHLEIGSITRQITMPGGLIASFTLAANVRDMGYTVNLTTDTASLLVYLVPPGLDRFGIWQPSYLNFELTLLRIPSKRVEVGCPHNCSSTPSTYNALVGFEVLVLINMPVYVGFIAHEKRHSNSGLW